MTNPPPRIIVVGAGVSGLAAAWRLKSLGAEVLCLEAEARPGGAVHSRRTDGYLIEAGPNSLRDTSPGLRGLIDRLGLQYLPAARGARTRYLFQGGRLVPLPNSPVKFLFSPFLPLRAKLRLLCEPYIKPRTDDEPETVGEFVRRRMGPGVAARLMDALVGGIYAGDQERLEVRSAFPKFVQMEREHGGILRGMKAARRAGSSDFGRPLFSFREGLSALPAALAAALAGGLRTGARAEALAPRGGGWTLSLAGGETLEADGVIVATSATDAGKLLAALAPGAARHLEAVPHTRLAVVSVGVAEGRVGVPLDGFGLLIPRSEKLRMLGVIWSSALYEDRAPEGQALLTVFIGGAHDPGAVDLSDEQLTSAVMGDLERSMGIRGDPDFFHVRRWPRAIPHPERGHAARMEEVRGALSAHPHLHLIGNYLGGISVPECMDAGLRAGEELWAEFQ